MGNYINECKRLISEFCQREYKEKVSEEAFADLTKVSIAHTTLTDDEIPVEVFMDLINRRLLSYAGGEDGVLIEVIQFATEEDVINQCEVLDFDALVSFDDEQLEPALAKWKGCVSV